MTWRRRDERGGAEVVGVVLVVPVVLFALLGAIQAGVWFHGRQTAVAAAQSAAEAERVLQPAAGAGQDAAASIARQGGLVDPVVTVTRTSTTVTVTVRSEVPMFLDIGLGRFSESVTVPRERLSVAR